MVSFFCRDDLPKRKKLSSNVGFKRLPCPRALPRPTAATPSGSASELSRSEGLLSLFSQLLLVVQCDYYVQAQAKGWKVMRDVRNAVAALS